MDDRRAALLLAVLALAGAGVRLALAPAKAAAPGDVRLVAVDTPPPGGPSATARNAAPLARPPLPGAPVDLHPPPRTSSTYTTSPSGLTSPRRQLCYAVHFQRVAYGDRGSHLRQAG